MHLRMHVVNLYISLGQADSTRVCTDFCTVSFTTINFTVQLTDLISVYYPVVLAIGQYSAAILLRHMRLDWKVTMHSQLIFLSQPTN